MSFQNAFENFIKSSVSNRPPNQPPPLSSIENVPKRRRSFKKVPEVIQPFLLRLWDYFEELIPLKEEMPNYGNVAKMLCDATGIHASTIFRIRKGTQEGDQAEALQEKRTREKALNNDDLSNIPRIVYDFFSKNLPPTAEMVLEVFVETYGEEKRVSLPTMRLALKTCGFKYRKTKVTRSLIMQEPRLIRWCEGYVLKIRAFRLEGRKIYYVDETWRNTGE